MGILTNIVRIHYLRNYPKHVAFMVLSTIPNECCPRASINLLHYLFSLKNGPANGLANEIFIQIHESPHDTQHPPCLHKLQQTLSHIY